MSDDFLSRHREEPRPEFAAALGDRLRAIDQRRSEPSLVPGPVRRWLPALAGAAVVGALAMAFTFEPVRAAARDFLDLFRVKRFAAVPVDTARLERLGQELDFKTLAAGQVQVLVPPQEPEVVTSPESGALAAGIEAEQPAVLPRGTELSEVSVARPGAFRVRLDTTKLQTIAQVAGVDDVEIPVTWNGATVEVEMPPVLAMRYARPSATPDARPDPEAAFEFLQATNPQIALPQDVDLAALGRLGLRIAGMSRAEAESFSRTIDWRATLLVLVPLRGATFREVEVSGHNGLLVTSQPEVSPDGKTRDRSQSVLMWASTDKVYAIHGPGNGVEILAMAQSVR